MSRSSKRHPELGSLAPGDALESFLAVAGREFERVCSELDRDALRKVATCIVDAEGRGGRVHVTGVGKPEHLAHYAAALFSSTGTSATFLHATEAIHGSIGQLRAEDVLIAISNSGETQELLTCIEAAKGFGVAVITVGAPADSALGRLADQVIEVRVEEEGAPLGLAPRASTIVELLALAALSVELQAAKRFSREDYARRHPAGALGRKSRRRPPEVEG